MPNKMTLQEVSNNDLINCLISRHELYARLLDPERLADAAEYRAELMRRLECSATCEAPCGSCVKEENETAGQKRVTRSWVSVLTRIYNLNVGESVFIAANPKDIVAIRSGMSDPCRIAYRGRGAYKTKNEGNGLRIWRMR